MIINHTSPNQIKTIKRSGYDIDVEFSGCLFFSDDIYSMSASMELHHYTIEIDQHECISAHMLEDVLIDEVKATDHIVNYAGSLGFDLDADLAYEFLDCSSLVWDHLPSESGDLCYLDWYIQGIQGRVARQMGFVACESEDEQGTVYIVDMYNRENLLKYEGEI